jgi:hypothetical protein
MASNMQTRLEASQNTQSAIDHVINNYQPQDFTNDDVHVCTEKNFSPNSCERFKGGPYAGEWIELGSSVLDTTSATGTSWVEIRKVRDDIDIDAAAAETTTDDQPDPLYFKGTGYEITSGYDGTATGKGKVITKVGVLTFGK